MNTCFYISDKDKDRHYQIMFSKDYLGKNQVSISNAGGEAMFMDEEKFFQLIDKYFKENF